MMSLINVVKDAGAITKESLRQFMQVLCPFAPHVANEVAEQLGFEGLLEQQPWPSYDEAMIQESEVEISIQVNGKLRGTVKVAAGAPQVEVEKAAREVENVAKHLEGVVKKTIFVPNKLVNFVV